MSYPEWLIPKGHLTRERLKELLHYDPETGRFTRLTSNRSDRVGVEPGAFNTKGYVQIRLDGKLYVAHRLAWLYVHGCWPTNQLDHINGIRSDNRIDNLREVTNKQNSENRYHNSNNTSGYRGVSYDKDYGMHRAYVCHNWETHLIGFFKTAEEAASRVKDVRNQLFTHNDKDRQQ